MSIHAKYNLSRELWANTRIQMDQNFWGVALVGQRYFPDQTALRPQNRGSDVRRIVVFGPLRPVSTESSAVLLVPRWRSSDGISSGERGRQTIVASWDDSMSNERDERIDDCTPANCYLNDQS